MNPHHQHPNRHQLLDLINDPICLLLMERDGVRPHDVVKLMRNIKPFVAPREGAANSQRRSLAA